MSNENKPNDEPPTSGSLASAASSGPADVATPAAGGVPTGSATQPSVGDAELIEDFVALLAEIRAMAEDGTEVQHMDVDAYRAARRS